MSIQWHGGQPGPQPGPLPGQSPSMRASHADRERAADVLKAGYAEGRLGKTEYDQRLDRVHQALTYGELHTLIADLPQGPVPLPVPAPAQMTIQPAVPRTFYPAQALYPLPRTNGTATGALICGVLTPLTWGTTAIPAVILGHKAKSEIRRSGERGDGYATAGLVLGYLAIGFGALFFLLMVLTLGA